MKYTKGEWNTAIATESGFEVLVIGGDDGVVADCQASWRRHEENEGNARLIAASVNTCQQVNSDNPLAVAESIKDMYEALKAVLPWAKEWIKYLQTNIGPAQGKNASEWFEKADKALTKAEGK